MKTKKRFGAVLLKSEAVKNKKWDTLLTEKISPVVFLGFETLSNNCRKDTLNSILYTRNVLENN